MHVTRDDIAEQMKALQEERQQKLNDLHRIAGAERLCQIQMELIDKKCAAKAHEELEKRAALEAERMQAERQVFPPHEEVGCVMADTNGVTG